MNQEEFNVNFLNKIAELQSKIDKLNESVSSNTSNLREVNFSLMQANKTFEQLSNTVKDLFVKLQNLELLQKMLGAFGKK